MSNQNKKRINIIIIAICVVSIILLTGVLLSGCGEDAIGATPSPYDNTDNNAENDPTVTEGEPSTSLRGPEEVRAGESITLTFAINASGKTISGPG